MAKQSAKILAVNPGSRYIGLAVFHDAELRDWRVRSLNKYSLSEKKDAFVRLLSETVKRHDINTLILKTLHPARSSKALGELVQTAREMAHMSKIRMSEFSIDELKHILDPNERNNKRRLMEEVAKRYPLLYPELEREKKSKNKYLVRMFEAVALGMVASEKLI